MILWILKIQNVSKPETVHLQHLGWHEDEVDDISWAFDETREAKALFYHNQFQTVNMPVGLLGEKLFLVKHKAIFTWSLEVQSSNWSHLIRSGVGLASLSSPSIDGEEGRPREPDV